MIQVFLNSPQLPFSQRLNEWIKGRVKTIWYKPVDREVPPEELVEYIRVDYFPVSTLYCEDTVFADKEINVMFRAWHDYIHLKYDYGFDLFGETLTAFKQVSELPQDWYYEKNLILGEVIGQAAYYFKNNEFPVNQREFTINLQINGI